MSVSVSRRVPVLSALLALCLLGCGEDPAAQPPTPPTACTGDLDCSSSELCVDQFCADASGSRHDLGQAGQARLVLNAASGSFDLYDAADKLLLRKAYGYAALAGFTTELKTSARKDGKVTAASGKDALGSYQQLVLSHAAVGAAPALSWQARRYQDGAFVFELELHNTSSSKLVVDKFAPVRTRGSAGGGLFLGQHPKTHRILENGSSGLLDHFAALEMADKQRDGFTQMAPGKLEGYSASNWSHLIWDVNSKRVWIAGSITSTRAITVMNSTYDARDKPVTAADGRIGFGLYSLEALYLPQGKPIPAGGKLRSESIYLHPGQKSVHQALEQYAQAIHDKQQLVTWTDRGLPVPNGWNSWAGSGGTGGYGTAINQKLMQQNLAVMADNFGAWGMDYFQMDDGWEPDYGDWTVNKTRFPDGFSPHAGIVKETLDAKLKPGIWIAAFSAYKTSQLYKTYQPKGWFMDKTIYGKLSMSEYMMLDMSHPDVLAWLKALGTRINKEWGFRWLKLDFSYPALLGKGFHDPSLTNVELYDQGIKVLRQAIGKDVFFMNIGATGVTVADGKRTTLDNAPVWDWDKDNTTLRMMRQGHKPTMAVAARRYFYQGRVFIVHPDLIMFRSDTKNTKLPRVTFNEARAFAAFVAATGGIVKLGDRMVEDLAPYPDRINVIRQLLPIHPQPSRPLDLMTREFPERYFKLISKTLGGHKEKWGWYAAFNLGLNWDFTVNPAREIKDDGAARKFTVDLAARGMGSGAHHVFEFWSQQYIGRHSGTFDVTVPSHDSRIYAIRPVKDRPQLLGHNRHITMGAAVVKAEVWDQTSLKLTLTMDVVQANKGAPFGYLVSFHNNGASFQKLSFSGQTPSGVTSAVNNGVLEIAFTAAATGQLKLVLQY